MSLESAAHLSGLVLLVLCFGSFAWGLRVFFRSVGPTPRGLWLIRTLGTPMALGQLWLAVVWPAPASLVTAIAHAMYAAALILFWWAARAHAHTPPSLAFSDDRPTHLVRTGPYRHIRHPFYSSYLLAWMAGAMLTSSWLGSVPVPVMLWLYVRAARLEEHKFLASTFGAEYEAYLSRAGMFWPRSAFGHRDSSTLRR